MIPMMASAEDPAPGTQPTDNVWTGKGQAGYVASQGNSDAKSANAALDTSLISGQWKHTFHLDGLYGQSNDQVSAERWESKWQSDYNFSPDKFVFGAVRYSHDMFSGFAYQGAVSAGFGYKFINTANTQLSTQAGVGFRRSRPELIIRDAVTNDVLYRVPLEITNEAVFTGELDYAQKLTTTTSVTNKLAVESGASNTLITEALAFNVNISSKLALSLGLNVQDNTKPPPGLKKVDTIETVNLVYSF